VTKAALKMKKVWYEASVAMFRYSLPVLKICNLHLHILKIFSIGSLYRNMVIEDLYHILIFVHQLNERDLVY